MRIVDQCLARLRLALAPAVTVAAVVSCAAHVAPAGAAGAAGAASAAAAASPHLPPHLDARAWAVIDADTGDTLASHSGSRELPIASTTKLMTAYLALQRLPLTERVRMAPYSITVAGESLLGVAAGARISVRDLLYGLILRSGNDAAASLARAVAGSEDSFVSEMNSEAADLGLGHTHYSNPIGLDAPDNYSSAGDLTRLSRLLLSNPEFARVAASRHAVLRSVHPALAITTRNTLLLNVPWVNGIKTGHTLGAGYVLLAAGRRKGVELISAVLGTNAETDRDNDSLQLLDYGFSLYHRAEPVRAGGRLADAQIRYSGDHLALVASRSARIAVRSGQRVALHVTAPARVTGPISKGARLGSVIVTVDGRRAAVVALVSARSISRAGALDRLRSDSTLLALLLCGGLAIGTTGAIAARRRTNGRESTEVPISREERQRARERRRRDRV